MPLGELFSLHGEEFYRRLERETLADLLASRQSMVLAVGGGLVTAPETLRPAPAAGHDRLAQGPGGRLLEPRRPAGRPPADRPASAGARGAPTARDAPRPALRARRRDGGHLGALRRAGRRSRRTGRAGLRASTVAIVFPRLLRSPTALARHHPVIQGEGCMHQIVRRFRGRLLFLAGLVLILFSRSSPLVARQGGGQGGQRRRGC